VADHTRVPVPAREREGHLLERALHRPVHANTNVADAVQVEPTSARNESHTVALAGVFEREGGVTITTPETWVAGLFARFDAAEEGTERPVQARDRILQKMHVDGGDVLPFGPYVFELRHLLVRADRYAAFLVGVAPLLQCRVVQLA